MKFIRCFIITIFTVLLLTSFNGCSKKNIGADIVQGFKQKPKLTELNFYFRSFANPYMDDVVKEIEKKTADKLNIKLNINWVQYSQYFDTINELLKSGDKIDAFSLNIFSVNPVVENGDIKDISQLFPDNAPDIYKRYTKSELTNGMYKGKLYAIPGKNYQSERQYVLVSDDLMKKYGLKEIKTLEDYEVYLKRVSEKDPGLNYAKLIPQSVIKAYLESKGYVEYTGQGNCGFYYNRNDPEYKIIPMESLSEYKNAVEMLRRWAQNEYIDEGALNGYSIKNSDVTSFNSCIGDFEFINGVSGSLAVPTRMYALYPEAICSKALDVYKYAMCFSNKSKNVIKALQFINWIGSSQESYDLIMYGIKGKDYKLKNGKLQLLTSDRNQGGSYYENFYQWGGSFFENIDFNRPTVNQPSDFWKNYKKSFKSLNKYPPLSTFHYVPDVGIWSVTQFQNRFGELRKLDPYVLQDDYFSRVDGFKEQQKQSNIEGILNSFQEEINKWKKTRK